MTNQSDPQPDQTPIDQSEKLDRPILKQAMTQVVTYAANRVENIARELGDISRALDCGDTQALAGTLHDLRWALMDGLAANTPKVWAQIDRLTPDNPKPKLQIR